MRPVYQRATRRNVPHAGIKREKPSLRQTVRDLFCTARRKTDYETSINEQTNDAQ
jgi:hypothetical protein